MGINQNGKASQAPFFKVLYWAQFYLYYTLTTYLRSPILTHTHVYLFADDTNAFKSNSPTVTVKTCKDIYKWSEQCLSNYATIQINTRSWELDDWMRNRKLTHWRKVIHTTGPMECVETEKNTYMSYHSHQTIIWTTRVLSDQQGTFNTGDIQEEHWTTWIFTRLN